MFVRKAFKMLKGHIEISLVWRRQRNWHPEQLIHYKRDVSCWSGHKQSQVPAWQGITILNAGFDSVRMAIKAELKALICFFIYILNDIIDAEILQSRQYVSENLQNKMENKKKMLIDVLFLIFI